jgi:hypothetical protein
MVHSHRTTEEDTKHDLEKIHRRRTGCGHRIGRRSCTRGHGHHDNDNNDNHNAGSRRRSAAFVVAPPPVVAAPAPGYVAPPATYVVAGWPGEWLNLRAFPNGPIVGAMPPGTPLTYMGNVAGPWGFVRTPAGYTGWAYLPYTYRVA